MSDDMKIETLKRFERGKEPLMKCSSEIKLTEDTTVGRNRSLTQTENPEPVGNFDSPPAPVGNFESPPRPVQDATIYIARSSGSGGYDVPELGVASVEHSEASVKKPRRSYIIEKIKNKIKKV